MTVFQRSFTLNAPLDKVWEFHSDPVALTRITPKPVRVQIQDVDYPVVAGSKVIMRLLVGPIGVQWNSVISDHSPMSYFTDTQIEGQGPFKRWKHTHRFEQADGRTVVADHVEYALPFGILGRIADALAGRAMIASMFSARARATKALLEGAHSQGSK